MKTFKDYISENEINMQGYLHDNQLLIKSEGNKYWHKRGKKNFKDYTEKKEVKYISSTFIYPGDSYTLDEEGNLHSFNDNPSLITTEGNKYWHKHGKKHRDNGPAEIMINGFSYWWKDGQKHREGGPAVEGSNDKEWYENGKQHRLDGPASIYIEDGVEKNIWRIFGNPVHYWNEPEIKVILANNKIQDLIKYPDIREKLKEFKHLLSPKDKLLLDLEWKKKI